MRQKGFTLVEVMVAVAVFAIIMLATVDIMLIVLRSQEETTRIQAIQDNARFSLELITKEMRTGSRYQIGKVCTTDGSEIHFIGNSGQDRVYYLDPNGSGRIYRAISAITNLSQCRGRENDQFNELTGDQTLVERLQFYLYGEQIAGDGQAMAIITLKIRPDLNVETAIVQRVRDL